MLIYTSLKKKENNKSKSERLKRDGQVIDYGAREIKKGICSNCGEKLVLRTARRGGYKGQKFYGCSNYPRRRHIVNVDTPRRKEAAQEKEKAKSKKKTKKKKSKSPKKKKTKSNKKKSYEISYELYKKGHSIEKISKKRDLALSTVKRHLLTAIKSGLEVVKEDFISKKNEKLVLKSLNKNKRNRRLKTIKRELPDEISYFQIKLVKYT